MIITGYLSLIAIVMGAYFIGSVYGWKIGLGVGLIAWGVKGIDRE